MKITHPYLWLGVASTAVIIAVAGHVARDANAQQATTQTQIQPDPLKDTNDFQTQPNGLQNRTGITAQPRTRAPMMKHFRASELVGMDLRGKSGDDEIGGINDIVFGPDGTVSYVAVSFGGFLGLGDKLFAVPFEAIEFVREAGDSDDIYARIDVTEQTLKNKPGFNEDNWPEKADPSFVSQGSRTARQYDQPATSTPDTSVPR